MKQKVKMRMITKEIKMEDLSRCILNGNETAAKEKGFNKVDINIL